MTFWRRLRKLHAQDCADEERRHQPKGVASGWLVFLGDRDWRVNRTWLVSQHPELLARRTADLEAKDERFGEVTRAVDDIRRDTKRAQNGHGSRLRELEAWVRKTEPLLVLFERQIAGIRSDLGL
jgi:hypothetical protein